jgi:hypothetical protein
LDNLKNISVSSLIHKVIQMGTKVYGIENNEICFRKSRFLKSTFVFIKKKTPDGNEQVAN